MRALREVAEISTAAADIPARCIASISSQFWPWANTPTSPPMQIGTPAFIASWKERRFSWTLSGAGSWPFQCWK